MSCSGFDASVMGSCSLAWIAMVLIFFIAAFTRKWGGEEMGLDFSFLWSLVSGFLSYIILITIFGSIKWALLAGIIGVFAGGYGVGYLGFGGEE